ncbi:protein G75A [Wood mouse herpesvirus]|uniref:Protein G75A n=1 Tax=Wood mouse herpesvirus TaxID=432370 RepID=D0U1R6_9GAMA|nr:protein G75A [Wood mouse herpesvirus]ACY41146.1 protein G75A [Wood mouse herpesvirus]
MSDDFIWTLRVFYPCAPSVEDLAAQRGLPFAWGQNPGIGRFLPTRVLECRALLPSAEDDDRSRLADLFSRLAAALTHNLPRLHLGMRPRGFPGRPDLLDFAYSHFRNLPPATGLHELLNPAIVGTCLRHSNLRLDLIHHRLVSLICEGSETAEEVARRVLSYFHAWNVEHRSRQCINWPLGSDPESELLPTVYRRPHPPTPDPVSSGIFLPRAADRTSVCLGSTSPPLVYATGYPLFLTGHPELNRNHRDPNSLHVRHTYLHVHSRIQGPGHAVEPLLFIQAWLPGSRPIQSTLGLFILAPSQATPFSSLQATYAVQDQTGSLYACGLGVGVGFIRHITQADQGLGAVLIHTSTTSSISGDLHETWVGATHPSGGDIVLIGSLEDTPLATVPPHTNVQSPLIANGISQAIASLVGALGPEVIVKSIRPPHLSSIEELLLELLFPLHATIDLSHLSQDLLDELLTSTCDTYEDACREVLFNKVCCVLPLIVSNTPCLDHNTREAVLPRDLLAQICSRCGLTMLFLGQVCSGPPSVVVSDIRTGATDGPADFSLQGNLSHRAYYPRGPEPSNRGRTIPHHGRFSWQSINFNSFMEFLLSHPDVESKEGIVRYLDRCGQGQVVQQQGCGPLDFPVSDYATVYSGVYQSGTKTTKVDARVAKRLILDVEAWFDPGRPPHQTNHDCICITTALGEQCRKLNIDPRRGVMYALLESLTNLFCSPHILVVDISIVAAVTCSPRSRHYELVNYCLRCCKEFCEEAGICFSTTSASESTPDGSTSTAPFMTIVFTAQATGPLYLAPKPTPDFKSTGSHLIWVSLHHKCTLSGSIAATLLGLACTNLLTFDPNLVWRTLKTINYHLTGGNILSIHDISDGGTITCLLEMAISGQRGADILIPAWVSCPYQFLLSETPGFICEVDPLRVRDITHHLTIQELCFATIGYVSGGAPSSSIRCTHHGNVIYQESLAHATMYWRSGFLREHMMKVGNLAPHEQQESLSLGYNRTYNLPQPPSSKLCNLSIAPETPTPKVLLIVFPGQPIHRGTLAAFASIGFCMSPINITELCMTDPLTVSGCVIAGQRGTLLPEPAGWLTASTLIQNQPFLDWMNTFYHQRHSFILGFGEFATQVLLALNLTEWRGERPFRTAELVDMVDRPRLAPNKVPLLQSFWLNVLLPPSNSLFFKPLHGSACPAWACGSHLGIDISSATSGGALNPRLIAARFSTADGTAPATHYPRNPSGGTNIAALCSEDGRACSMVFNPTDAVYLHQWQHLDDREAQESPWRQCLHHLLLWVLATRET